MRTWSGPSQSCELRAGASCWWFIICLCTCRYSYVCQYVYTYAYTHAYATAGSQTSAPAPKPRSRSKSAKSLLGQASADKAPPGAPSRRQQSSPFPRHRRTSSGGLGSPLHPGGGAALGSEHSLEELQAVRWAATCVRLSLCCIRSTPYSTRNACFEVAGGPRSRAGGRRRGAAASRRLSAHRPSSRRGRRSRFRESLQSALGGPMTEDDLAVELQVGGSGTHLVGRCDSDVY